MSVTDVRCADLSRAAEEPHAATASTAEQWLLIEVPGPWGRDVTTVGTLPTSAHETVSDWLARTPRSRVLFLRRRGRSSPRSVAFVVRAKETSAEVRRIELVSHDDLAHADLETEGELVPGPLVLVCGHGTRDACCALRGTAVYGALAGQVGDDDLWLSSHQGGHRFAANVLVLPVGVQLGRVGEDNAARVVSRALERRIELDHYRGRTCYEPRVQAAEHAIRKGLHLDAVDDLSLRDVDGSVVRFCGRDGGEYSARVEEIDGPRVPASCGAEPEPQKALVAELVEPGSATSGADKRYR
ncbi:MAG: hypothetical protein H0U00_01660 [Actinobacteria bacterium]|nr:hypothetical protein [Actinomycetota bacterium]